MMRNPKRRMVAGLVVTLGVADGVGIYVAQHRLDKNAEITPREMAVANEALNQPIAIRANGLIKAAPVLATSVVAPRAEPAEAAPPTVRFAIAEPVKVAAAPVAHAAERAASRQTAPVVTGRMAVAEKPVSHRAESRHSATLASNAARVEDLRIHEQRIPSRLPHAERRPAREDAFAAAFGNSDDQVRLPEPAYGRPDAQPSVQASAELPPLELSTAQIHSEPSGTSDADAPLAPPTTATSADDIQPKS